MRKRTVFLILGGLVLGVIVVLATREREPECWGKSLSEWLDVYAANENGSLAQIGEATCAIRHIGSNGLPCLLRWIQYETPAWKRKFYGTLNHITVRVNSRWQLSDNKELTRSRIAVMAMVDLGPEAEGATAELVCLMNSPRRMAGAANACAVLRSRGRKSVPVLAMALSNQNNQLRAFVCGQLQMMGTNARPAVPDLLRVLGDPLWETRQAATNALRLIDPSALERAER